MAIEETFEGTLFLIQSPQPFSQNEKDQIKNFLSHMDKSEYTCLALKGMLTVKGELKEEGWKLVVNEQGTSIQNISIKKDS
jgi:hypothetical protein